MFGVSGKVGASTESVRSSKDAEFGKECAAEEGTLTLTHRLFRKQRV